MKNFWDERYSSEEFVYGTSPNRFFKEKIDGLKPGRLLMLGEGEGRNAVYAASLGWKVDAVDFSGEARRKALELAAKKGVTINYNVADLNDYVPANGIYDAVGVIFLHMNPGLSSLVHNRAAEALKRNGKLILQVFEKGQLGKKSGGPQSLDALYSVEEIKNNFAGLTCSELSKDTIMLDEGEFHTGEAVVVQFLGIK